MFQRLRRSTTTQEQGGSNKAPPVQKVVKCDVESIKDDQPYNPYTEIQLLTQHTDIVRILMKIDDRRCASAADDCLAIIWDIQVGRKLWILQGHSRPITCLLLLEPAAGSYDDPVLLTGASNKQIFAWNIENGECVQCITDHGSSVRCLVALKESLLFCSGGEKLCMWDSGGKLLCNLSQDEGEDIQMMIPVKGDRLVAAVDKYLVVYGVISHIGDVMTREIKVLRKLSPHRESIRSLVNISDGSFASGSIDGTVMLWSTQTLAPTHCFNSVKEYEGEDRLYPYSIQHMASVDERYIFAAVGSGFCVYDSITHRLLAEKANAHYSKILHLGFVYNGSYLATCSEDGSIRLWGSTEPLMLTAQERGAASKTPYVPSTIEKFVGMSMERLKQRIATDPDKTLVPLLVGECLGHSGAVQMFVDFGVEGMVSCGIDNLVVMWKDGILQDTRRNQVVRDILMGPPTVAMVI